MMRFLILLAMAATAASADIYPRQPNVDAEHYVFQITIGDDRMRFPAKLVSASAS